MEKLELVRRSYGAYHKPVLVDLAAASGDGTFPTSVGGEYCSGHFKEKLAAAV